MFTWAAASQHHTVRTLGCSETSRSTNVCQKKKNIGDKTRQTRRRPSAQLAHSSTILSLASCASGPTRTSLVPFLCIVSLKIRVDLDPDHRHPVLMCVCVLNKIKCCSHAGRLVLYAQIIKSPHFTLYSINHHTLVCSLQNLMKVFWFRRKLNSLTTNVLKHRTSKYQPPVCN